MSKLEGIAVALLTPFQENGAIDEQALRDHCNFLIGAGVHNLFILGTTGEVFLLTREEREAFVELVLDAVKGRIPVFAQVGSIGPREACSLAKHGEAAGLSGVGAITPYYFHTTQEEMKAYYLEIAGSVGRDFPVYLYNLPGCTTNDLLPETIESLAQVENIVGIKNSMNSMERFMELVDRAPEGFHVIQGEDILLMPSLLYGARGSVSGIANAFPELFVDLYKAMEKGEYPKAHEKQRLIREIHRVLHRCSSPAFIKKALACRGLKESHVRRPLMDLKREVGEEVERGLASLGLI